MCCCAAVVDDDPCVLDGVRPFLAELRSPVGLTAASVADPRRGAIEAFVYEVFARAYGADVQAFYPNLLGFHTDGAMRAAVGYRDGTERPLFSEHYLNRPAHEVIGGQLDRAVRPAELVEVGNLALASAGDARWVIAAVTVLLHRQGYRWVLFTAVRPLVNAFRRLGLNPIRLAEADPARLPDGGERWGRYYDTRPVVCAGNIETGYRKLRRHVSVQQPALYALLNNAARQGVLAHDVPRPAYGRA